MNDRLIDKPFLLPAIVLGVSIIGGLWILSTGISGRGADSTIAVTGSATQNIKADQAKWRLDIRRTAYAGGTASAYATVARDGAAVKKYFTDKKLPGAVITESVISTDENYKQNQNEPTTYNVRETITIETTDVDAIDEMSRQLTSLSAKLDADTLLSPQQPEYFVSTLPDMRIALIGKAVQDARSRATEIAKSGDTTVGALKSAASGVVQVLSPNSTNVEDYGSYDTSSIQKQVMVTARAVFYVR